MSNIQNTGGARSNEYEPTDYSSAEGMTSKDWSGMKKAVDAGYAKWAKKNGVKVGMSFNYGKKGNK